MNTKKWTTKDGRKIRIRDMSDTHLLNTIRMLRRIAETARAATIAAYLHPLMEPMGDGAQDCFDSESEIAFRSTAEDYMPAIYDDLTEEAERRLIEIQGGAA